MSVVLPAGGPIRRLVKNRTRIGGRTIERWEGRGLDKSTRRRYRFKRTTLKAAKAEAARINNEYLEHRSPEIIQYVECQKIIYPEPQSPIGALTEWKQAKDILRDAGLSLADACRIAKQHCPATSAQKDLPALVKEFIATREAEGLGTLHITDLTWRLNKWAAETACPLHLLTGPAIKAWLTGLKLSPRSQRNYRGALSNFFNWCIAEKYLPPTFNELRSVKAPAPHNKPPAIFPLDDLRLVLSHIGASALPVVLLVAFAGLRAKEAIFAVTWENIRWPRKDDKGNRIEGWITVPHTTRTGEKTKTGARLVPLFDNLCAWLQPLSGTGPIATIGWSGYTEAIRRAIALAQRELIAQHSRRKIQWQRNGLRHSFVTYLTSFEQDLWKVSEWTGHTVRVLKKYYQRADVYPETGRAWFAIYPPAGPSQLTFFGERTIERNKAMSAEKVAPYLPPTAIRA